MLAGYCSGNINSTSLGFDDGEPNTFVNSNSEAAVEVEKSMNAASETAFTMTLKQVLSTNPGTDGSIASENDIVASEFRDGIPYSIHNADGSLAGIGETGPNGEFKLYAGQYVRLNLPDSTMWTVSEKTSATPNYTLAGLSPDPGNGKLKKLNENLMLINLPAVMQYTLVYDSNGGTGGPGTIIQAGNNTFTVPSLVPTKDGYDCVGWSDAPGGETVYQSGNSVKIPDGEYKKTIYAVWVKKKTYTVTYTDGVVGKNVFSDQGYEGLKEGDETPAFVGTPTREGYAFMGWSPAVKDKVVGSMANEDGEIIYTATWRELKVYSVVYYGGVVEGHEVFSNETHGNLKEGDPTPKCASKTEKDGYKFMGWEPAIKDTVDGDMADENGKIVYTATWQKVEKESQSSEETASTQ